MIVRHQLRRVMIVDWFGHMKNTFADDKNVLYVSFIDSEATIEPEHDRNFTGVGEGRGCTINIALPKKLTNETQYVTALHKIVLPIAYQFNPKLILIAPNFKNSPVSERCLQLTIEHLTTLANGRVAVVLDEHSTDARLDTCLKPLLGDTIVMPTCGDRSETKRVELLKEIIQAQRPFWTSLHFDTQIPAENVLTAQWVPDANVFVHNPQLKKES